MMLAVVIPTFNERDNVQPLLSRLERVLKGISHEIIFVDDDSPDGTAFAVREISAVYPNVRVLQRIGRRGLSSACIEGMLATSAEYIAVMDADLQHDESILPQMLELIETRRLDLVVGSRHIGGGSMGSMKKHRAALSRLGSRLSALIHKGRLSDPMSGFFLVRRSFFERIAHRLSGVGFKILLDIVLSSGGQIAIGEVPYHFRERKHGASKLDLVVGLEYLELLLDKIVGDEISVRFALFCCVGALGVGLHLLLLYALLAARVAPFQTAQLITTATVMVLNYTLNNMVSYRDRKRRGLDYWTGLLTFCAACSVGLLLNVLVAGDVYRRGIPWMLSALIGLLISAVWNYGVTSMTTWRQRRKRMSAIAERQIRAVQWSEAQSEKRIRA